MKKMLDIFARVVLPTAIESLIYNLKLEDRWARLLLLVRREYAIIVV